MSISFSTPESQATGKLSEDLIEAIYQYQESKYQDWYLEEERIVPPGVILSRVDTLQEQLFDTNALLNKYPLAEHQLLWLISINEVMIRLLRLKSIYCTGRTETRSVSNTTTAAPHGRPSMGRSSSSSSQITINLRNLDSNCIEITAKLFKLSNDIVLLIREFFSERLDIAKLLQNGSETILALLFSLSESSIKVLTIDLDEEHSSSHKLFDNSSITLVSLTGFVKRYYEVIANVAKSPAITLHLRMFPTLVECIKVAFYIDQPQTLVPLIKKGIISPTSPLELIENCILDFNLLVDYYRYTSFAMLAMSLAHNPINIDYLNLADTYFKVLLRFPNMNLKLWNNLETKSPISNFGFNVNGDTGIDEESSSLQPVLEDDDEDAIPPNSHVAGYNDITGIPGAAGNTSLSSEVKHITVEDRQEISLLYLLTYLLKLKSLKSLISPAPSFTNELQFLVTSLSNSISVDIHKSVSVSSGSLSMSQLYQKEQERERKSSVSTNSISSYSNGLGGASTLGLPSVSTSVNCKSVSSILHHGTYKEKLTAIISFFEILQKDKFNVSNVLSKYSFEENGNDMAIESEFDRLVSNMESVRYPGKIKYVNAIRKITSIIKAVSLLHWVRSTNINNIPESILQRKFSFESHLQQDEILKNLVEIKQSPQGNIVHFTKDIDHQSNLESIDKEISDHIKISELTSTMNALREKLKNS